MSSNFGILVGQLFSNPNPVILMYRLEQIHKQVYPHIKCIENQATLGDGH